MDTLSYLLLVIILGIASAAGILIQHLGRQTVPSGLVPLANAWTRSGRDPQWIRFFMWIAFTLCAVTFLGALIYGIYISALDLGRKW